MQWRLNKDHGTINSVTGMAGTIFSYSGVLAMVYSSTSTYNLFLSTCTWVSKTWNGRTLIQRLFFDFSPILLTSSFRESNFRNKNFNWKYWYHFEDCLKIGVTYGICFLDFVSKIMRSSENCNNCRSQSLYGPLNTSTKHWHHFRQ